MNKVQSRNFFIGVASTIVGVVLAGVLLKYGHENDVPVLKDAANGFDQ